jgi:UDP-N-acetylmuramate--alanine ligase
MNVMPLDIGTLHFVGIGGIGMSGIAEILHDLGYEVQGSDLSEHAGVKRLRLKGIKVFIGHDAENLQNSKGEPVSAVVVSSAIKESNPELVTGRAMNLPIVRRAEMLAELMRLKWAMAIGGTHGKTTTTSMVGAMLEEADLDPTVINGGIVNRYASNTRLGKSDWMVVEADESDGTFTHLPATVAVVTNIDEEHMEHYGSFDAVRDAFRQFVSNIPFYGFAVLCGDHPEVQNLASEITGRKLITYGFNPQTDVRATNVTSSVDGCTFDVSFAGGEDIKDIFLPMPGNHNVLNSLAAIAIAKELGIAVPVIKKALGDFSGVKRRFTKTGEAGGITVIDDYGHHPVEISAVLKAARDVVDVRGSRLIAVMQPHRYSRLADLFDEFCTCFNDADTVVISDVYSAGEDPIEGISREALVEAILKHGHRDVHSLVSAEDLPQLIVDIALPGDFVLCLGAGDITIWANDLPGQLEDILTGDNKQIA